jgi:hypothetical protein
VSFEQHLQSSVTYVLTMSSLINGLSGQGSVGDDGKPAVNMVIEINADAVIELAGESVFQSPIIKAKIDSLNNTILHLQRQQIQLKSDVNNGLYEINRLKNEVFIKTNECVGLRNSVNSLVYSSEKLRKDLIESMSRVNNK